MDEIGHILQEARERKGLTLAEVHAKLRINLKYLKALEEGQFDVLPSPTHVRGYLGKYARFLGLDNQPLLEQYEIAQRHAPRPVSEAREQPQPLTPPLPEPESGTFFAHANVELNPTPPSKGDWVGRVIILAFLIFIGLSGWRFGRLVLNSEAPTNGEAVLAAVTDVLNAPEPVAESGTLLGNLTPDVTSADLITSTSRTTGGLTFENNLAVVPQSTRSPLPATIDVIDLQLDVTERTWMRIAIDGITVYEGQAQKGETLNWTANESVQLRTGNAAGVFVTINDTEVGRLGARGQVIEELWETTQ